MSNPELQLDALIKVHELTESTPTDTKKVFLQQVKTQIVATLDALSAELFKTTLKTRLKPLGFSADVVEMAFERKTSIPEKALFPPVEPWPDPVDGQALMDQIRQFVLAHVILPAKAEIAIVLWIVHTYLLDEAEFSPILAICSATKRCGKTTLLEIVRSLSHNALAAASITSAVVYRAIEAFRPTLLLDEADATIKGREDIRAILNSGHSRTSATTLRCEGDNHTPVTFSTWAAKCIAGIGKLSGTLQDRSIPIWMIRKTAEQKVEKLPSKKRERIAAPLRRRLVRWAEDHCTGVELASPEAPAGINDRAVDSWQPLLAIADVVGGEWPELARAAASTLEEAADREEEDTEALLLGDIREVFGERAKVRMGSEELVALLCELDDRPWGMFNNGRPLTKHGLARLLKPLGVRPTVWREGSGTERGYVLAAFQSAFKLYPSSPIAEQTEHSPQAA